MTTDYSYTAIAAFVPPPYREKLADCSRVLGEKFKSWYILNEQEFPPHVTIWIAYVPTRNLEAIATTVQNALSQIKPFEVSAGDAKIEDGGYIAIEVKVNEKLRALHNLLLDKLNTFREGYLSQKYVDTMHTFSQEQQESLKKFGTRAAGILYAPHITVGIASADAVSAIKQIIAPDLQRMSSIKFTTSELVFFRQGKPGRSIEIIERFPLQVA